MSERYWYQDGSTVFWIAVVAGIIGLFGYGSYQNAQLDALPFVVPKVTGRLNQPLFGDPSLEITVWHQYPATLRNVLLFVNVNEDPARAEKHWEKREHSFETWQPNEDHAVKFAFPLKRYDPNQEIRVGFGLLGKTIKPYITHSDWLGEGWKPEK